MTDSTLKIALDQVYQDDIMASYQLYPCFRWVKMKKFSYPPKEIIVVDKFKPFMVISYDYLPDVTDSEIDMMEQMFAPPDYDSMLIRGVLKEETTTHFHEMISYN